MKKNIVAFFLAVVLLTTLFASNFSIAFAENENVETPTTDIDSNTNEENIPNGIETNATPSETAVNGTDTQNKIDNLKFLITKTPYLGTHLPKLIDYIYEAISGKASPPTPDDIVNEKLDALIAATGRIEASQQIEQNAHINEIASQLQTFVSAKMLLVKNIINYQNELFEALQVLETQKTELAEAETRLKSLKEAETSQPDPTQHADDNFVTQTSATTNVNAGFVMLSAKSPMETSEPVQTEEQALTQAPEPEATLKPQAAPEANSLLVDLEKRVEELKKSVANKEKEIEELKSDITNSNNDMISAIKEPVAGNTFEMTVGVFGDYISDKAVTLNKNPFVNYYDYSIKSGHFAADANKLSEEYEEKIISIYASCMVFDMFARQTQYVNATSNNKRKEITTTIGNRIDKYNQALTYYNQMLSDRKTTTQRYYITQDNYIEIAGMGSASYKLGYFTASSSNANQKIINALQHGAGYSNDKYIDVYKYMSKVDKMIEKEFTDEVQTKYSLRQFLESKNFAVPAQAKYLAVGGSSSTDFSFTTGDTIRSYRLDRTPENGPVRAEPYVCYTKGWGNNNYNDTEFCYFYDKLSSEKATGGADLIINGNSVHYDDIAEAWNVASDAKTNLPSNANVTVKLQQDWIAKPIGTSNRTSFGVGVGFNNNAIGGTAILDLNGYTVNRNQKVPVADGSVFKATGLKILSSAGKPGIITGGNTTGNGGGVYAGKISGIYIGPGIAISNCVISGNYAKEEGGGIFIQPDSSNKVYLTNVQIIDNKSDAFGGGVYQALGAEVEIAGKIVITGNIGKDNRYNYCLANNSVRCATIGISKNSPLTTDSRITISHKEAYGWNYITDYTNRDYKYVFGNDLGYYLTLNYGSGDKQYVWNDKRGRGL